MSKSINEFQLNLTSASEKLKNLPALELLSPIAYRCRFDPETSILVISQRQDIPPVEIRIIEAARNLLRVSIDKSFQEFYGLLYSWMSTQLKTTWYCLPIASKRWKLNDHQFSYTVYLQPGKIMIKHKYRELTEKSWHEVELFYELLDVKNDKFTLAPLIVVNYLDDCGKFMINCADTKFAQDAITKALNKILKKI